MKPDLTILDNTNPSEWFNSQVHPLQGGNWAVQDFPDGHKELSYECDIANTSTVNDQSTDFVVTRGIKLPVFLRKELYKSDGGIWVWTEYKESFDFVTDPIPNYPFTNDRNDTFYGDGNMCIAAGWYDRYFNNIRLYGIGDYVLRVTVNSDSFFPEDDYGNNTKLLPFKFDGVSTVVYDPSILGEFTPSPVTNLQSAKDKNQVILTWTGQGKYYTVSRDGQSFTVQSPTFNEKQPQGKSTIYSVIAVNEFGQSQPVSISVTKGK